MMRHEFTKKRTLNSKTFDNQDGSMTLEAHGAHIHYKNKQTKQFENVDCSFTPTAYGWEMRKNNYELEIPKQADGWFKFINAVQVDPRTGDDWDKPDEEVSIKPLDVLPATGKLISKPEWKGKGIVLYKNAYGLGVDLEVMARNTGFVKEVILNEKPADLSKDLEFSFEVALGGFEIKPKKPDFQNLRKNKIKALKKFKNDKTRRKEEERWEDELERDTWDRTPLTTSDSIILKKLRKTWFRKFNLTDAEGNQGIIKVRLEEIDGKTILTKVLDKRFLETAVYPVRTDTTTNYYAGAGDGVVRNEVTSGTWTTAHDATTGTSAYPTDTTVYGPHIQELAGNGTYWWLNRLFLPIDTSGLGAGATVSAAVLYLWPGGTDNTDNDGDDWINVVQTDQPSTSTLTTADFNNCGATDNPTEGATRVDIGNITGAQYNTWTLNATGRGWIDKTGVTMLGMREGHDCIDSALANSGISGLKDVCMSEYATTSQDPYLAVTYSVVTGPAGVKTVNGVAAASVKSINGTLIASVKTMNGSAA